VALDGFFELKQLKIRFEPSCNKELQNVNPLIFETLQVLPVSSFEARDGWNRWLLKA
jgi:hypothetical protein